jgi:hypothetical protein
VRSRIGDMPLLGATLLVEGDPLLFEAATPRHCHRIPGRIGFAHIPLVEQIRQLDSHELGKGGARYHGSNVCRAGLTVKAARRTVEP